MKHGPIALIDKEMPVIVICTKSDEYDKMISNIREVGSRNAIVIGIIDKENEIDQLKQINNSLNQILIESKEIIYNIKLIRENSYENAVLAYDRDSLNFPKDRVSSFSILMTNSKFNLVNFIEKPTQQQIEQKELVMQLKF